MVLGAARTLSYSLDNSGNAPATLTFGELPVELTRADSCTSVLAAGYCGLSAQSAALSGTGRQAVLALDFTSQTFGSVDIGTTATRPYTVANNGNAVAALNYSAIAAPLTRGGTCAATLGAGATCTVVLSYAPARPGICPGFEGSTALSLSKLRTGSSMEVFSGPSLIRVAAHGPGTFGLLPGQGMLNGEFL